MNEILFFAVNRQQARYFAQLADALPCPAQVVKSRKLAAPAWNRFSRLKELELAALARHHGEEELRKRRFPAWFKPLYTAGSRLALAVTALRYWETFADEGYHTLALWNGYHVRQAVAIRIARLHGKKIAYFENGPLPETTTLDFQGINAANSLPRDPAFYRELPEPAALPVRLVPREGKQEKTGGSVLLPQRFLFVPFQVDHDTQLTVHSPWVKDMAHLFRIMEETVHALPEGMQIVFKEHPSAPVEYPELHRRALEHPRLRFANKFPTQELIEKAEAVVTVNSTVGVEALLLGKRVAVLGDAYYGFAPLTFPVLNSRELEGLFRSLEGWKRDDSLVRRFLGHLKNGYALPQSWKEPGEAHFREAARRLGCVQSTRQAAFYFVSTPFHLFNAIAVALGRPEEEHHLFFIDQPYGKPNPYFKALEKWEGSPFASHRFFDTRAGGFFAKALLRKAAFRKIKAALVRHKPARIFTGNDRRIEYLYAYAQGKRFNPKAAGAYLDDGVYSYIGEKSPWYKDTAPETFVKRLFYGGWYHRPRTVGSSPTIREAYVAFPDRVHGRLKEKHLFPLDADRLRGAPFTDYAALLLAGAVTKETLASLDALVLLPHLSVLKATPGAAEGFRAAIADLGKRGLITGVKYHPRQDDPDPLGLAHIPGVAFLPGVVPFEAMLPLLNTPVIVGDTSTVLLTAKWLRPELRTVSVKTGETKRLAALLALFTHLGIEVTDDLARLNLHKERP